MLRGLPDRPLYRPELNALTDGDRIRFAMPATPESVRDDRGGRTRIHDLLLFLEESVAVVAYDEGGWTAVANESGDEPYEAAIDALIEYRGYEVEAEAATRELVRKVYGEIAEFRGGPERE